MVSSFDLEVVEWGVKRVRESGCVRLIKRDRRVCVLLLLFLLCDPRESQGKKIKTNEKLKSGDFYL